MKQSTIGGTMTAQAWQLLATRHKPSNTTALAREVTAMAARGLTPRDIDQALHLMPGEAAAFIARREEKA